MLAYEDPYSRKQLYYWNRQVRGSEAEVDYLIQQQSYIIPIEVKRGAVTTLRSLQAFLSSHHETPYGICFSTKNYSEYQNIKSYPLYAIAQVMGNKNKELQSAINTLIV